MNGAQIITSIDDALYTWCLIYLLAAAGIFFTVRTRFVQIRLLKDSFKSMMEKKTSNKRHQKGHQIRTQIRDFQEKTDCCRNTTTIRFIYALIFICAFILIYDFF